MKESNRQDRRAEIEDAAFQLLASKGFSATSMLAVARAAKASNETLYRWYGDKTGLFSALVARNAATITQELGAAAQSGLPPLDRLARIGPLLLSMLLGPRAIALNRAAAGDESGELGRALAKAGRDAVQPMIAGTIQEAVQAAQLTGAATDLTDLYLTLLIGDCQIRRVTGAMAPPDPDWARDRADRALHHLLRIAGTPETAGRPGPERLPED